MHIIGGQVQSQSQHQFSHSEQRISVSQRQANRVPTAAATPTSAAKPSSASAPADTADTSNDKELSLLKALVEALTGKTIRTLSLSETAPPQTEISAPAPSADNSRVVRIDATQISETEITQVAFSGQFDTADGSHISLDLQYALNRSYAATEVSVNATNANAKDPLILNFNGRGVALDAQRIAFDLNGDGQTEAVPTLAAGSAYLALDRNGNGAIDNGTELFGPVSNDGYAELAKLDSDGNGFIDGADPQFSQLLLFRPGTATQTLASHDVGAIFLGSAASPARLTDSRNQTLGQLRASGFYLTNQGGAGLVQQLDLTA